jgi:cholesterol transport system auxiliary component
MFIILISLMMTSCSLLQPVKLDDKHRFLLTDLSTPVHSKVHQPLTILVSQPSANPGFRTEDIVYVSHTYQLKTFSKNSWVAPPADMLLPLISQSLRNTKYFHAVVESPFSGLTDLRVDTQILAFQQEIFVNQSYVKLSMQVTLVDNRRQTIIGSKTLTVNIPSETSPYGGVIAANRAVGLILNQLTHFVITQKIAAG